MELRLRNRAHWSAAALAAALAFLPHAETPAPETFIVQGVDLEAAATSVDQVGGTVTHELGIIDAVAARLSERQLHAVRELPEVRRVFANRGVEAAGKGGTKGRLQTGESDDSTSPESDGGKKGNSTQHPDTHYPTLIGADVLHAQGITGLGVTIAVLDSGSAKQRGVNRNTSNLNKRLAHYDAIAGMESNANASDSHGHGTHVASIALNSAPGWPSGKYSGVAPDADYIPIKALDGTGRGTYADVIRGIDWVVTHKDLYGIRVLNLSISATPVSRYWDDPLNQAVMRAWQAGIVVVASAGNTGPLPMTIGVPGNNPYVITVGAMTDSYTPHDLFDDRLTTFSSAGPTREAFVKPDVVAPGGHMLGHMYEDYTLAVEHPEFHVSAEQFVMSGTSQSAAVVSDWSRWFCSRTRGSPRTT